MKYLISSNLPDDFDPSTMDPSLGPRIHAFNAELEAAGALFFACGLHPASFAKTLHPQTDGEVLVTDGPFMETKEHLGGFLIIEAANMEEALEWGRKGAQACGTPIELREIFFQEE